MILYLKATYEIRWSFDKDKKLNQATLSNDHNAPMITYVQFTIQMTPKYHETS